jgi:hypothetical protein
VCVSLSLPLSLSLSLSLEDFTLGFYFIACDGYDHYAAADSGDLAAA